MHTAQQNPQSILNTLFSFDAQMSSRLQLCLALFIKSSHFFLNLIIKKLETSKSLDSWKPESKFSISI